MSRSQKPSLNKSNSILTVRLDKESKRAVVQAAKLRGISINDYVQTVIIAQAQREVAAADQQSIGLTPDEQRAFWQALHGPVHLTPPQKRLAALMRGEN